MDFESYQKLDALNWSSLRHMMRSPKHFRAAKRIEREDTDSMRLGRAVHCAVLEPAEFMTRYVTWTGGRRYGKDWDAFQLENANAEILTKDQHETAIRIAAEVRANPLVKPLLVNGRAEQTLTWTDANTGIACKARADLITSLEGDLLLVDLKTARTATDLRQFQSAAYEMGYLHQAAFYSRGMVANMGQPAACIIVAVETSPPFDVAVYELDADALWRVDQEIDQLLARLKECRETNNWPGVFDTRQILALPRWVGWDDEADGEQVPDPEWMEA